MIRRWWKKRRLLREAKVLLEAVRRGYTLLESCPDQRSPEYDRLLAQVGYLMGLAEGRATEAAKL